MARQYLAVTIRHQSEGESSALTERDLEQPKKVVMSSDTMTEGAKCEDLEKIIIDNDDEKYFQVGVQLPTREKEELVAFLR